MLSMDNTDNTDNMDNMDNTDNTDNADYPWINNTFRLFNTTFNIFIFKIVFYCFLNYIKRKKNKTSKSNTLITFQLFHVTALKRKFI